MSKPKQIHVEADQRRSLIAEAAYFRAEHRGFQGGCPIEDWLEAEQEISRLSSQPAQPRTALVFLEKDLSSCAAQH